MPKMLHELSVANLITNQEVRKLEIYLCLTNFSHFTFIYTLKYMREVKEQVTQKYIWQNNYHNLNLMVLYMS